MQRRPTLLPLYCTDEPPKTGRHGAPQAWWRWSAVRQVTLVLVCVASLSLLGVAWLDTPEASTDLPGLPPAPVVFSDLDLPPELSVPVQLTQKPATWAPGRVAPWHGVAPADQPRYKDIDMFACDNNQKVLLPAFVNDDFCDCDDGSDEPGTAACPNGRFFCAEEGLFFPANRVDDGVCDCCDGSDEGQGLAACTPQCELFRQTRDEQSALLTRGRALRETYVRRGLAVAARGEFGPDNAFFPLGDQCFSKSSGEYDYTVCFFTKVEQKSRIGQHTSLGHAFRWTTPGATGVFAGGAPCPGGQARQTRVQFVCADADALQTVGEPERCVYEVVFGSPAACAP